MNRLLWLAVAVVACAGLCRAQDYFLGLATSAPPAGTHLVSPNGLYIGLASAPQGPFDPLGSLTVLDGQEVSFGVVTNASFPVFFTMSSAGGLAAMALSTGVSGGSAGGGVVGLTGDVLVFRANLSDFGPTVYYQSRNETNMGFVISIVPCVAAAPSVPKLVAPLNGTTAQISVTLVWSPAAFGAACANTSVPPAFAPASTRVYRTLLRVAGTRGAPWDFDTDVPATGAATVSADTTLRVLSESVLTMGTRYEWAIAAEVGSAESGLERTVSQTYEFSTPPAPVSSAQSAPVLRNGAVLIQRVYPDVPAGFFSYNYYRVNVTTAGGLITVLASSGVYDVPGAPGQGSIVLYGSALNLSSPSSTIYSPSSSAGFEFRSRESGLATRRSLIIPSTQASEYFIGVEAIGGSATYSIVLFYACPDTHVLRTLSSTECVRCPDNMVAAYAGATSEDANACRCSPGFFPNPIIDAEVRCRRCLDGALCDGLSQPQALRGFWASADDRTFLFSCPVRQACLGGPTSSCRAGYTGPLCSQCADGFYALSSQCYSCRSRGALNFWVGVTILVLFLVLCAELARWYRKTSSLTVFVNFLQTLAIMPLFQFGWPQYLNVFFNDLSGFNLNPELTAPECTFSLSWTAKWVFTLFLPVIVLGGLGTVYVAIWLWRKVQLVQSNPSPVKTSRAWDIICPTFVTFLLFFYISITRQTLSFFDCTKQADAVYTLDSSADLLCYSSDWYQLLPLAVFGVLAYALGIPLVLHGWLYVRHHHLFTSSVKGERVYRWLGPLYLRYKSHFFFWEAVVFARKAGLIIVGAFFTSFTLFQAVLAIAILVIALWLQMLNRPFAFELTNTLESFLILAQVAVFLVGVLFQSQELPNQTGLPQLIFAGLVALFAACFVFALVVVAYELREVYRTISPDELRAMERKLAELEPQPGPTSPKIQTARSPTAEPATPARHAPAVGQWSSSS